MDTSTYPKGTIILSYTLLGGTLGGLIIGIISTLMDMLDNGLSLAMLGNSFGFGLVLAFFGLAIGALPALLTALVICHKNFIINNKLDYLRLFILGGLFGTLPPLVLTIISMALAIVVLTLPFFLLGGVCAVIIAYFVVPKTLSKPTNKVQS